MSHETAAALAARLDLKQKCSEIEAQENRAAEVVFFGRVMQSRSMSEFSMKKLFARLSAEARVKANLRCNKLEVEMRLDEQARMHGERADFDALTGQHRAQAELKPDARGQAVKACLAAEQARVDAVLSRVIDEIRKLHALNRNEQQVLEACSRASEQLKSAAHAAAGAHKCPRLPEFWQGFAIGASVAVVVHFVIRILL